MAVPKVTKYYVVAVPPEEKDEAEIILKEVSGHVPNIKLSIKQEIKLIDGLFKRLVIRCKVNGPENFVESALGMLKMLDSMWQTTYVMIVPFTKKNSIIDNISKLSNADGTPIYISTAEVLRSLEDDHDAPVLDDPLRDVRIGCTIKGYPDGVHETIKQIKALEPKMGTALQTTCTVRGVSPNKKKSCITQIKSWVKDAGAHVDYIDSAPTEHWVGGEVDISFTLAGDSDKVLSAVATISTEVSEKGYSFRRRLATTTPKAEDRRKIGKATKRNRRGRRYQRECSSKERV